MTGETSQADGTGATGSTLTLTADETGATDSSKVNGIDSTGRDKNDGIVKDFKPPVTLTPTVHSPAQRLKNTSGPVAMLSSASLEPEESFSKDGLLEAYKLLEKKIKTQSTPTKHILGR